MILGSPASWTQRLIDGHALIVGRIAALWPECAAHFQADSHENTITDHLARALQKDLRSRFLIMPQHKLLDDDCHGDVVTKGVVDIAVFINLNNDIYLAFECKRLNVHYGGKRQSLSGDYVDKGMMRYVSAQYARNLPLGAMLGYVMDGDLEWALERLDQACRQRSERLRLSRPSGRPTPVASEHHVRSYPTYHLRAGDIVSFEIRHSLLALGPEMS